MSETVWSILRGPPAYFPRTPWGPFSAIAAAALIMLISRVFLPFCLFAYTYGKWPSADLRILAVSPALGFFQQTLELGLVWLAAGLRGGKRSAVLALNRASGGAQTYIVLACLVTLIMMPIVFFFNSFGVHGYARWGPALVNSTNSLVNGAAPSGTLAILLVLLLGAPLSEEFLIRGFLLSAIARSRIGFWGAALVTNALFTILHGGYPLLVLVAIPFTFGLMMSYIIWKTGSLWACVIAHAATNLFSALTLVVRQIILA
jgi:membrane protease YdiL (CAAX protease family)